MLISNVIPSLSGSIQVLQNDLKLQGDDKRLMDIVVRETDRLNAIITDFLEYARPKAAHTERIELRPLVEETIMLLKNSKVFDGSIRVTSDIAPGLTLTGDAQRLRQVFWNLLINACQAMPGGGAISVFAAPSSRSDESAVCEIIFADTGPGISREHLDKIFDPFFTTKTGGTGLGLAIVYRIVDDHQGTITVDSEAGKGTRFILRLPLFEEMADVPGADIRRGGREA